MHREHCWNNRSEPAPGYWHVVRQYQPDGRYYYVHEWIENKMSKPCGQPGKGLPPADVCVGCKHLMES
jgi:hypothetical protein